MMFFERFNKWIKGMCTNRCFPVASVANGYVRAFSAFYYELAEKNVWDVRIRRVCEIVGTFKLWVAPDQVVSAVYAKKCTCC